MNVLLTVDTEVYPLRQNWQAEELRFDVRRDIFAETKQGVFGLDYQIGVLNAFQLKAVFFVEPLFAQAVGTHTLGQIVERIQGAGHEVQLHIHPEWLVWSSHPSYRHREPQILRDLSSAEQASAIDMALSNLKRAGASDVSAFRAGDFAADSHTLAALVRCGLRYDSSYNRCYSHSLDDVRDLHGCVQPMFVNGVWEVPVAWWRAQLGGPRPAQITASSHAELAGALLSAWKAGWKTFVVVFHTFELLKKRRQNIEQPTPDWFAIRRFLNLCQFLSEHPDKFRTCGFADLDENLSKDTGGPPSPITSPVARTARRWLEQGYRRLT